MTGRGRGSLVPKYNVERIICFSCIKCSLFASTYICIYIQTLFLGKSQIKPCFSQAHGVVACLWVELKRFGLPNCLVAYWQFCEIGLSCLTKGTCIMYHNMYADNGHCHWRCNDELFSLSVSSRVWSAFGEVWDHVGSMSRTASHKAAPRLSHVYLPQRAGGPGMGNSHDVITERVTQRSEFTATFNPIKLLYLIGHMKF